MKRLPLKGKRGAGKHAIVDDDIHEHFLAANLYLDRYGYVRDSRSVKLHRIAAGASKGEIVDHLNRDKLDNRRANLRLCTQRENLRNRSYPNHLGYRGVRQHKPGVYFVEFRGKRFGRYPSRELAALAWNELAVREYGEFAHLNKVEQ